VAEEPLLVVGTHGLWGYLWHDWSIAFMDRGAGKTGYCETVAGLRSMLR
jgi:hypothetical protein